MEYLISLSMERLCTLLTSSDEELLELGIPENLVEDLREDIAKTLFFKVPKEERRYFFWIGNGQTITLSSYEEDDWSSRN